MAWTKGVAFPPTFYALQGVWLKLGSYLLHYNLTFNYNLANWPIYAYHQQSLGIFPFWGMIPILAALFLLVGASYAVLKNKWLSLLCFGPITFISVVFMGQIDVFPALFIFISLILMQRALKAEKYFSLLLFAYLTLGISMQFKTYRWAAAAGLPDIYAGAGQGQKTRSYEIFLYVVDVLCHVPLRSVDSVGAISRVVQPDTPSRGIKFFVDAALATFSSANMGNRLCIRPVLMAVRVLGNPKRALQDNRYFVSYNSAIVAWFFIAVMTLPQWWMFLIPVALLALDNFQNKNGVLFCILIVALYFLYPMYFNFDGLWTSYHIPAIAPVVASYAFAVVAALLLFWVLELKRELGDAERRLTSTTSAQ